MRQGDVCSQMECEHFTWCFCAGICFSLSQIYPMGRPAYHNAQDLLWEAYYYARLVIFLVASK